MAPVHTPPRIFHYFLYFSVILCCFAGAASANRELNEDNWRDILEGEWMVEFYAPWCPACNALQPAWKQLSERSAKQSLNMKTAGVDVTKSPGLSGRFVVTALPTIYHVKDGQFRQYKGPRDVDSMVGFVSSRRWRDTEPVSAWKAPDSIQMTLVAEFFKLSQALRSIHTELTERHGLPAWGSYLVFALATILVGALLGLVLVCIIDMLYPPRKSAEKVLYTKAEIDRLKGDLDGKERSDDDNEVNDDIVDDEAERTSDAERNSPSDSSEEETPKEAAGDQPAAAEKTEVRKRRPRKAD